MPLVQMTSMYTSRQVGHSSCLVKCLKQPGISGGYALFAQDRKEQLKKSRLGQVVMFLYKLPDETAGNRRMAKELVERWSRPIFDQYRDARCSARHTAANSPSNLDSRG